MTYLGMQIQSVRFVAKPTETRVENLLRIIEEFLSSPGPPAVLWRRLLGHLSSLTLLVKGGMLRMRSPDSPQVQVGLPRRIASHPLGSSVSGGSFMVVFGDSNTRGRRSFPPNAGLELLLGRVRRRLGRHRRGTPNVRSLDSKPKGTLHQHQEDDGSAERPLRVQLSSQRQDDRSLCDNVTTVAYLRRLGGTRSQVLFLKAREILLLVESMEITLLPQFIQVSLNTRADLLSRPNLVIGSEWTLHQEVVQDLLLLWPAIIDRFATSLAARLPVFFTPA